MRFSLPEFEEYWNFKLLMFLSLFFFFHIPKHILCHFPSLTALIPPSLFSSSFLPFFQHSLVLFDLFTRVQMSRQRERSGKGLVSSKVWMVNTVLAARGCEHVNTWVLEHTHTPTRAHALGHTAVTSATCPRHSARSRQPCHLCACVCVCFLMLSWVSCEHGWLRMLQLPGDDTWPCWTLGQRSLVVRGLQHLAFKGQCLVFYRRSGLSAVTTNSEPWRDDFVPDLGIFIPSNSLHTNESD